MKDLEIDRIQVYAIGPNIARYKWVSDMEEQFMTNTVMRVFTKGGLEGVAGAISFSEYGYSSAVAETLRRMAPDLIGLTPMNREATWHKLRRLDFPTAPQAQSLMDIAIWDLAAKAANMPLFQFLGGARSKILAYASTPLFDDVAKYVDAVGELQARGYRAIKFHCWCDPERDLKMVRAVHRQYGNDPSLRFMLDVEMRYTPQEAQRVGKELAELDYEWFEAPFHDSEMCGYQELRRRVDVPIVPAGNWLLSPGLIEAGIRMGCWSSARFDVTVVGGFTPARKMMAIAAANSMNVEIQSWGYTLTQAANLHLMLSADNCKYFEQAVPFEPYEYGANEVIRADKNGYVHAPVGPGLGITMDWEAVQKAAFLSYEILPESLSGKSSGGH